VKRNLIVAACTLGGLIPLFLYPTSHNVSTVNTKLGASAGYGAGSTAGTGSSAAGSSTVTGDPVDTRWGTVQVQITVANKKIIGAQAIQYPDGNRRDQDINSYALPILSQEAVAASSAKIDAVSGATVTSDGYIQSLQSAVDKANL
jgi:hypothetical protein